MIKLTRALALAAPLALLAAACGNDDSGSDTTAAPTTAAPTTEAPGDGGAEGLARAQAVIAALGGAPTEIGPTIPLTGTPEAKTVAWLECEITCASFRPGFETATDLLGWDLEVISVSSFDPAPGFQQALDLGADFIAITGTPPALVQDQIAAAQEAGVGIFSCYEITDPDPAVNNIYMQCGDDDNVYAVGSLMANKIIVDSGGDANVLMVNIPDFPVLVSERQGAEDTFAENCPSCTFTELAVTLDQVLAGEVPGAIISALQNDPSINYLYHSVDAVATGVTPTLEDAGLLEQVSQVGVDLNAGILQEIIAGTQKFWTVNPVQYAAFLMVDAMARQSLGMDNPEERDVAVLPVFFVEDTATAESLIPTDDWVGPEGMADQFAALWGVG